MALPVEGQSSTQENLTLEAVAEERRRRKAEAAAAAAAAEEQARAQAADTQEGGMEGLEKEADQQGAFNPETGEINWDCPCLGGMADGPCGEQFKAAFSCFVYSTEEPKGMDCIEKFKYGISLQAFWMQLLTGDLGICRTASESTLKSTATS
jgi:intermembrane space import and assembly protein 40